MPDRVERNIISTDSNIKKIIKHDVGNDLFLVGALSKERVLCLSIVRIGSSNPVVARVSVF